MIEFTEPQKAVVKLLVSGRKVHEIAAALHCTEGSVRSHIQKAAAMIPNQKLPPMTRLLVYAHLVGCAVPEEPPDLGSREIREAKIQDGIRKEKARVALRLAVKRGEVVRPDTCSTCGQPNSEHRIEAHHADYDRPYDVVWLCQPCHLATHHPRL